MRIFPSFALWLLAPTTMLLAADTPPIQRVVFEGATSEYKWSLKELNPDLPSDWEARIQGREDYFTALPPRVLNRGRRSPPGFYAWNLARRHGTDSPTNWLDLDLARLDFWGLNTIGNWSDPRLWASHKKAYQVNLGGWGMREGYLGLPDIYADEFEKTADRDAASQCAPHKDDPWLLGYFIANEPPWPGRESLVVDMILEGKASPIQREAKSFLAEGDTPERRKQFIYRAFNRFLEVTIAAIRRHDPNHLILGLRFGGGVPPPEMLRACKAFDVYSLNAGNTPPFAIQAQAQ
jgi:hypothetical protein